MNDLVDHLHPVGVPREYLNDKLLVFFSPFLHLRVCTDDEFDIFGDVLNLAILSM